jgi:hypothetical protein
MGEQKSDVLQGMFYLMVLKTLGRAKFYSLNRVGRNKIEEETENWERVSATMARILTSGI